MTTYIFNSLRGSSFEIDGDTPEQAWNNLCEREKDEGSIWRCHDRHCNRSALKHGFQPLLCTDPHYVVYKVKRPPLPKVYYPKSIVWGDQTYKYSKVNFEQYSVSYEKQEANGILQTVTFPLKDDGQPIVDLTQQVLKF